jgi:hypothetical protein
LSFAEAILRVARFQGAGMFFSGGSEFYVVLRQNLLVGSRQRRNLGFAIFPGKYELPDKTGIVDKF